MSELTAKENIKTADTVKRITATAVMAALTTLMTAYILSLIHISEPTRRS